MLKERERERGRDGALMLLSNMLDEKELLNVSERKKEREETEHSFMLLSKLQTEKKILNVNIEQ